MMVITPKYVGAVCFLLGNSPASELYMPTFRNTLFHLHLPMKMEQSVPKCRHIKFRLWGITQKKTFNMQNTSKVWNQEYPHIYFREINRNFFLPRSSFNIGKNLQLQTIYDVRIISSCSDICSLCQLYAYYPLKIYDAPDSQRSYLAMYIVQTE